MKYYDLDYDRKFFVGCPIVSNDGNWNIVDTAGVKYDIPWSKNGHVEVKPDAPFRFQALSTCPGCNSSSFGGVAHVVKLIRHFDYWNHLTEYGKQLFKEYAPEGVA